MTKIDPCGYRKLIHDGVPPTMFWLRTGQLYLVHHKMDGMMLSSPIRTVPGSDYEPSGPDVHPRVLVGYYSFLSDGMSAIVYASATYAPTETRPFSRKYARDKVKGRLDGCITDRGKPGSKTFILKDGDSAVAQIVRHMAAIDEDFGRTDTIRYVACMLNLQRLLKRS